MGPQLDQAELLDLGEGPVAARPRRGTAEGGGVGGRVGDVEDDAVDAHQAQPVVERPRRLGPPQRADDPAEEVPHRRHAQPPPGHAEVRAGRRLLADAEPPGVLEDLADRQVGQQPHREHHPEDDLVGQDAIARVHPAGRRQCLSDVVGADNLFESRQVDPRSGPPHRPAACIVLVACESRPPGCLGSQQTQGNRRL